MQIGFMGFFMFMVLIVKIIKELTLYLRKSENPIYKGLVKGFLGSIAAVLGTGVFNIPLAYHLGIFFWFLVGLVPPLSKLEKE